MLYILTELERNNNPWTKDIIHSVEREFSKRRIDFAEVFDINVALKKCDGCDDVVLIPTPATSLIVPIVEECNKKGIQVIVPNAFQDIGETKHFHCVKGDVFGIISKLFAGFKKAGKENVALYGINSNSQDDLLLAEAFNLHSCGRGGIYFNDGDAEKCFKEFHKNSDSVNAIICANDYIAIDLIERAYETDTHYFDDVIVVSFSNTLLSRFYNKAFTSIAPDLNTVGSAVADIYGIVKKERAESYNSIVVYIDYEIYERGNGIGVFSRLESEEIEASSPRSFVQQFDFNKAYDKDPHISNLLRLELQLNMLSRQQLYILAMILKDYTNEQICEKLFLSPETVRYHIKKTLSALGCKSKTEVKNAFGNMFSADNVINQTKEDI